MSRPTEHVDADGVALKILLVEDDAKLADVLARFLRRAGYACAIAESGVAFRRSRSSAART